MVVRAREVLQEESRKERAQTWGRAVGPLPCMTDAITANSTWQNSGSQRLSSNKGCANTMDISCPTSGASRQGDTQGLHSSCRDSDTLTKWPGLRNTSEAAPAGI